MKAADIAAHRAVDELHDALYAENMQRLALLGYEHPDIRQRRLQIIGYWDVEAARQRQAGHELVDLRVLERAGRLVKH